MTRDGGETRDQAKNKLSGRAAETAGIGNLWLVTVSRLSGVPSFQCRDGQRAQARRLTLSLSAKSYASLSPYHCCPERWYRRSVSDHTTSSLL